MARMLRRWLLQPRFKLELHLTPDIVDRPPGGRCDVLINPANEALVGTKQPYFPMRQSPPKDLLTSEWCGMEAGPNMFYAVQVVDGLVHVRGGHELREACQKLPELSPGIRCPVGGAVWTPSFSELSKVYDRIVHTVPPMYSSISDAGECSGADAGWEELLSSCYIEALKLTCAELPGTSTVAVPLLGAGARGAPPKEAARVAADALIQAASEVGGHKDGGDGKELVVSMAVREDGVARELEHAIEAAASAGTAGS